MPNTSDKLQEESVSQIDKYDGSILEHDIFSNLDIENQELALNSIEYRGVFNESCRELLIAFKNYLDPVRLSTLFPSINLNKISDYNFSNSIIKFIVLEEDMYDAFYKAYESSEEEVYKSGSTASTTRAWYPVTYTIDRQDGGVDEVTSIIECSRPLILVQDCDCGDLAKNIEWFKSNIAHEIVHNLCTHYAFSRDAQEGIVELFARLADRMFYFSSVPYNNVSNSDEGLVKNIYEVILFCEENEISTDDVYKALLTGEGDGLQKIKELFIQKTGDETLFNSIFFQEIQGSTEFDRLNEETNIRLRILNLKSGIKTKYDYRSEVIHYESDL